MATGILSTETKISILNHKKSLKSVKKLDTFILILRNQFVEIYIPGLKAKYTIKTIIEIIVYEVSELFTYNLSFLQCCGI